MCYVFICLYCFIVIFFHLSIHLLFFIFFINWGILDYFVNACKRQNPICGPTGLEFLAALPMAPISAGDSQTQGLPGRHPPPEKCTESTMLALSIVRNQNVQIHLFFRGAEKKTVLNLVDTTPWFHLQKREWGFV